MKAQRYDARPDGGCPIEVLLIGPRKEDVCIIEDLLNGSHPELRPRLNHVITCEQAVECLRRSDYDLVLVQAEPYSETMLHMVQGLRSRGIHVPVVLLSERADETTLAEFIRAGAADLLRPSELNPRSVARAIPCTASLQSNPTQFKEAQGMLGKLMRAVEHAGDLILMTDRQGIIEYVNPAFEVLTGYSREEVVGKTPRVLKSGHQDDKFYRELWATILSGGVFRGVFANKKKNGDLYYVEKTIAPVRDGDGNITNFIACDRDITERRRLEAQLFQAQKMDAVGKLAGGVAHDFNNLLMIISASAELTLETLAAAHPLRGHVEQILTASRRAADLTRQLLAFGRKQMQALQVLDLNWVIQDVTKMLPRLIGEDIQLTVVPGHHLGKVKVDPVQIEQIILNLATNARDAMPQGGKLTIETAGVKLDDQYLQRHTMVVPGDYVMLAVSDSGQGIPHEHQPHIFEPFYTTKDSGKGTGLGLATVYGIVKQNGGYIWVYSEPGVGTCFKIYLPCATHAAEVRRAPLPPEKDLKGSETLLLVEDEGPLRKSAAEFLARSGYTVLQACDGRDAIRVAGEYSGPIHLMVTDVVMPHMSGGELAQQLSLQRPTMKTVFVSGYAENTVLRYGVDLKNRFLQKPFSLKMLARKIREALDTKASAASAST